MNKSAPSDDGKIPTGEGPRTEPAEAVDKPADRMETDASRAQSSLHDVHRSRLAAIFAQLRAGLDKKKK